MDASAGETRQQASLSSWHIDIRIPINFQEVSSIVTFEALNSVCLSSYQSDVIPPIQMRWRTMGFSRFSTGDSDIPSSCEMKDGPAFKKLL